MRRRSSLRGRVLKILFWVFWSLMTSFLLYSYWSFTVGRPLVGVLKTSYPVIHYWGPLQPPQVELTRSRPRTWVSLSNISSQAVAAILVSEDWAFYQHRGFDWNQMTEAIKRDYKEHRFARGASTITQQVVKNIFLDREKTMGRKLKEIVLAIQLENVLKKTKILEIYLNIAEWGTGIFGVSAASWHYFLKPPEQLTAKEGAFLAMLLPSPKRYSQSFEHKRLTEYAQDTVESILEKMYQAGYLSELEMERQKKTPFSFEAGFEKKPVKTF